MMCGLSNVPIYESLGGSLPHPTTSSTAPCSMTCHSNASRWTAGSDWKWADWESVSPYLQLMCIVQYDIGRGGLKMEGI